MALPFADLVARAARWSRSEKAASLARRAAPLVVFAIAFVVRIRFVAEHPPGLYVVSDMAMYDRRADHLLSGDLGIWDTFTPVGYPALLALLYATIGKNHDAVGALQALLGALTATLTHTLALRVSRSELAALAAGLALALYLPLVLYTGFLLTETAFTFLLLLALWSLARALDRPSDRWAALAGVLLGAATAVRPNLLAALPFLAVTALWKRPSRITRRAPLIAVIAALPVIALVVLHNSRISGKPAGLASNGGLNFFLGHCECRAVRFPGQRISEVSGYQNRLRYQEIIIESTPAHDEAHFYRRGLAMIAADPAKLVRGLVNVIDGHAIGDLGPPPAQPYWPGWNAHDADLRGFARGALALVIAPAWISIVLLARRRRLLDPEEAPRLMIVATLGSVPLMLYLYLGDPRIRVAFDPLAMVLAADAWRAVASAARARLARAA